jgi:hypothetical protein
MTRRRTMKRPSSEKRMNIAAFFTPEMSSLENSINAYALLLRMYSKSDTLSDKVADDILNFLIIVNSAIREKAATLEADLSIHFKYETVSAITDTSDATVKTIRRKSKECISFLEKLHKKAEKETVPADKRELVELANDFNATILNSMREAKDLLSGLVAAHNQKENVEMNMRPNSQAAAPSPANKNVDDLMDALGKIGF